MNESPNIYTAINEVMQQVGYVQKTGQMRGGGNYKYAGEAEIIATIRPAMVDAGIIMYPAGVHDMRIDTYPTKNSSMNHVVAIYTWVFTHAESSTSIEVMTVGEGADVGDKSANKSMTAAKKYALLQTFLIETGNDPDDSSSQDMQRTTHPDKNDAAPTPRPQNTPPVSQKPVWNWQAFWPWTNDDLGLNAQQVHEALGVQSIKDEWLGTEQQARTILQNFSDDLHSAESETARILREEASIEDTY